MLACVDSNFQEIDTLIKYGADVNYENKHGHTALIRACVRNNFQIVEALIKYGADVNYKNSNVIKKVCMHYNKSIVLR